MIKIFDGHCDALYKMWKVKNGKLFYQQTDYLQCSFQRLRAGGVKVQTMAIFVPHQTPTQLKPFAALEMVDLFYRYILQADQQVKVLKDAHQLRALEKDDDSLYILLSLEGAGPLQGELTYLRIFYELGIRSVGLTWNYRNEVADGVGERSPSGLSAFGVKMIAEMNRLHMAIDVSHLAEQGFWDCLSYSTQPIMASHSNAKSICNHPRNLSDEQLVAIFQKGGVVGVNFVPFFLSNNQQASITDVLKHIDHMLSLGGEDGVVLGSDFDGAQETTLHLEHSEKLASLLEACQKLYSERVVTKLFFSNWLAYYSGLWNASTT